MRAGDVLLVLALVCAAVVPFCYILSPRSRVFERIAGITLGASALFVSAASALLLILVLTDRFDIEYIFANSSHDLPIAYKVSVFWAGKQGSFLFWALCEAWISVLARRSIGALRPAAVSFLAIVQAFLAAVTLADSPFSPLGSGITSVYPPQDGAGLNELLQNPWIAVHPPVVFVGYAATCVPAAAAFALLIRREDCREWFRYALPWTVFAWISLGLGILLGAYWSYEVLGWGGYWGWDPVENASLVPWLVVTALMHGLLVEKCRGSFRRANVVLALSGSLLVFYAAFLTRSDVLQAISVHTFGGSSTSGLLVWFMRVFLVGSAALIVLRWRRLKGNRVFASVISRDYVFFLGIVALCSMAFYVLVGTSLPIIGRMIGEHFYGIAKDSQIPQWLLDPDRQQMKSFLTGGLTPNPSAYVGLMSPLALVVLLLMAVAQIVSWNKAGSVGFGGGLLLAIFVAAIPMLFSAPSGRTVIVMSVMLLAAAVFVFVISIWQIVGGLKLGLHKIGGHVSHAGTAIFFVGVVLSANGGVSPPIGLKQGETEHIVLQTRTLPRVIKEFSFTSLGLQEISSNKAVLNLRVESGKKSFVAKPSVVLTRDRQVLYEPYILSGFGGDIYVAPNSNLLPYEGSVQLGESVEVGRSTITLAKLDVSQDGLRSYARFVDDETKREIKPYIEAKFGDLSEAVSVPGTAYRIAVNRINVESRAVEIIVVDLSGKKRTIVLVKDTPTVVDGVKLIFRKWVMPKTDHFDKGVGVQIEVDASRSKTLVTVFYVPESGSKVRWLSHPALMPDGAASLELLSVDIKNKTAVIRVEPIKSFITVSVKPFMWLLWIGAAIAVAGGCLAIWRRAGNNV